MIKQIKRYSSFALMLPVLASCMVGPDAEPVATIAEEVPVFINAESPEQAAGGKDITEWWQRLGDPQLDQYVSVLLADNLSLKEAGERVIQARARYVSQRGGLFPSLSTDGSRNRSFQPLNGLAFPAGGDSGRFYNTNVTGDLNASWQIDLFGRIRRSMEAADAQFEASVQDQRALRHSLIADVLRRRVAIAVNGRLLELAKSLANDQNALYQLVRRRYDLGANTELADVYLTEEGFRTAQADIHGFEQSVAQESYALDVLLGKAPGSTKPEQGRLPLLPPPNDLAPVLPIALLDRRPDLQASALRVVAANADIGVAIADLYPDLTFSGSIGVAGDGTAGLFNYDQLAGSFLTSVSARIFEGGALRANIRIQESEARELAAAYAGEVLEAVREVETALKDEQELAMQLQFKERSVFALKEAEQLTESRYRLGVEQLRDLLETRQRRYQIEQDLLRTQQQKWDARISLYLALGGDWIDEEEESEASIEEPETNVMHDEVREPSGAST